MQLDYQELLSKYDRRVLYGRLVKFINEISDMKNPNVVSAIKLLLSKNSLWKDKFDIKKTMVSLTSENLGKNQLLPLMAQSLNPEDGLLLNLLSQSDWFQYFTQSALSAKAIKIKAYLAESIKLENDSEKLVARNDAQQQDLFSLMYHQPGYKELFGSALLTLILLGVTGIESYLLKNLIRNNTETDESMGYFDAHVVYQVGLRLNAEQPVLCNSGLLKVLSQLMKSYQKTGDTQKAMQAMFVLAVAHSDYQKLSLLNDPQKLLELFQDLVALGERLNQLDDALHKKTAIVLNELGKFSAYFQCPNASKVFDEITQTQEKNTKLLFKYFFMPAIKRYKCAAEVADYIRHHNINELFSVMTGLITEAQPDVVLNLLADSVFTAHLNSPAEIKQATLEAIQLFDREVVNDAKNKKAIVNILAHQDIALVNNQPPAFIDAVMLIFCNHYNPIRNNSKLANSFIADAKLPIKEHHAIVCSFAEMILRLPLHLAKIEALVLEMDALFHRPSGKLHHQQLLRMDELRLKFEFVHLVMGHIQKTNTTGYQTLVTNPTFIRLELYYRIAYFKYHANLQMQASGSLDLRLMAQANAEIIELALIDCQSLRELSELNEVPLLEIYKKYDFIHQVNAANTFEKWLSWTFCPGNDVRPGQNNKLRESLRLLSSSDLKSVFVGLNNNQLGACAFEASNIEGVDRRSSPVTLFANQSGAVRGDGFGSMPVARHS